MLLIIVHCSMYHITKNEDKTPASSCEIEDFKFHRNSYLQAACDTPIARTTGCVCPHHGYRSATPRRTTSTDCSLYQGQQGDVNQSSARKLYNPFWYVLSL